MAESTKPYLIRAIHEWCSDNGYRPYLAVAVDEHTVVPREFVRDGEIVLNVSIDATNRLRLGNELIEFEARFGGVARQLSIPVENVTAIYSAESGQGMSFDLPEAFDDEADVSVEEPDDADTASNESDVVPAPQALAPARGPVLVEPPVRLQPAQRVETPAAPPTSDETPPTAPTGGRPRLTRVK